MTKIVNKELFLDYELSQLVKDLGYKDSTMATVDNVNCVEIKGVKQDNIIRGAMCYITIDAPTYQEVFDWFHDHHYLFTSFYCTSTFRYSITFENLKLNLNSAGAYNDKVKYKGYGKTIAETRRLAVLRLIKIVNEKK